MSKLTIFLNKIDNFLYQKKAIFIYLMVVLIVGAVFFIINNFQEDKKQKYQTLKNKLENLKNQQMLFNTKIVALQNRIKTLNLEKVSLNKQKDFYYELISLLDFIYFNKQNWGKFVKDLVKNSNKYSLKVAEVENKIYDLNTTKLINKKMDISLKLEGPFLGLLSFLYFYENKKALIRVSELEIDSNRSYSIKFSIYEYKK